MATSAVALDEAGARDFAGALSKAAAAALGKPEAYCMAGYTRAEHMVFGGSGQPCAFLAVSSIGALGAGRNADVSAALTDVCARHLGVAADRVYITFTDVKPYNWGHNGGTF